MAVNRTSPIGDDARQDALDLLPDALIVYQTFENRGTLRRT
jgi:hypothetical protein